jgi:hypothetical protein
MGLTCFEEFCVFTEARERACKGREKALSRARAREQEVTGGGGVYDNQQVTEGR